MANTQNTYQTNVAMYGSLDASFLKMTGMTMQQFVLMQKNAKQVQVSLKNMSLAANGLPPVLARANVQVNHLNSGFRGMQGLVTRLLFYRGIYAMAGGIRNAADEMGDFLKKSLQVSAVFERQKFAMSNIMGSGALGAQVANRLAILGESGYGANSMMDIAKKLSAQGVPGQNLVGTTKELANINAAAGGNSKDLETLTDMYGRVMSKGYVEKRSAANFGKQGIPMMEELVKLYGGSNITGPGGESIRGLTEYDKNGNPTKRFQSGLQKVQEMLAKQMISTRMFQLALKDMVSSTGFAADGMERYSHTYDGAVGVIGAKTETLMRYLGDIERRALQPLLDWFAHSGFWGRVKSWLSELSMISESFTTYMEVVGGPQVLSRIKAASDTIASLFGRPEFKQVHAGEDVVMAPAAGTTGAFQKVTDWLKEFIDVSAQVIKGISDFFKEIVDEFSATIKLFSDLKRDFGNPGKMLDDVNRWGRVVFGGSEYDSTKAAEETGKYYDTYKNTFNPGGSSYNPNSFPDSPEMREYIKKNQENTEAIQRLTDTLDAEYVGIGNHSPMRGTGGMLGGERRGLSDASGAIYEQYPWEGHSANYGAWGNRKLYDDGTEIGLGRALQGQGHPLGSWVRVRMSDGTTMLRQVKETSERNHGVEFFSNQKGKYTRHGKVESIESASPPVTINYHVHAIDSQDVHRFASEHAETLAKHIKRVFMGDHSRSAVV